MKFRVFDVNRHTWEYKIGPEVKAWVNERLPVWLEDEPEWFNDVKKSLIPDEFISDPALLVRVRSNNVKAIIEERRRSLILVALAPDAGQVEVMQVAENDVQEEKGEEQEEKVEAGVN